MNIAYCKNIPVQKRWTPYIYNVTNKSTQLNVSLFAVFLVCVCERERLLQVYLSALLCACVHINQLQLIFIDIDKWKADRKMGLTYTLFIPSF